MCFGRSEFSRNNLGESEIGRKIFTTQIDAADTEALIGLFNRIKPKLVIHVALPYQDLTIMDACLTAGVDYLDTANYEPLDNAKFEYKWQWDYRIASKKPV